MDKEQSLIAPSILSADFSNIREDIRLVETAGADILHLDVMDGHFVPNITFGPKMVKDIKQITKLPLDVHLMISEPEKYVVDFAKAGADWISVHFEASVHLNRLINQIKELGCKAGVVINPATSVDILDEILPYVDYILLMSVNPGFGGQKFIDTSFKKAARLREKLVAIGSEAMIEMDGGIDLSNIKKLKNSGVDVFVAGNSVFGSGDPTKAISEMKKILNS
ncbi:MAG: ribulose-phosphate 3-epimerase [Ignavibacteria bacterium]|nr:ribulose-phosphate 3-epimerase [Ignavibacteria bacterium]MCC7159660.1 ribulose-phosphate 3-epimerase [Ignavibacteria bacterium]